MMQDVLDKLKTQDYAQISKSIESFIKDSVERAKKQGIVLGLSGGIDSAVTAALAKNVYPKNTLVMIMPDSKISPAKETQDALKLIDDLKLDYKLLDINLAVNEYAKILEPNQKSLGNLRARMRTNILYYYANIRDYLVVGSSDKSEYMIGYFTKFGDGGADILPTVSLYKTQIRELGKYLGIPQNIIDKKSSPNLWPDHDAQTEIGATYDEIDAILYCMIDKHQDMKQTRKTLEIPIEKIEKIHQMYQTSKHKRELPARHLDVK